MSEDRRNLSRPIYPVPGTKFSALCTVTTNLILSSYDRIMLPEWNNVTLTFASLSGSMSDITGQECCFPGADSKLTGHLRELCKLRRLICKNQEIGYFTSFTLKKEQITRYFTMVIYRLVRNWWYSSIQDDSTWENKSKIWNNIFSYDASILRKSSLEIYQVQLNLATG